MIRGGIILSACLLLLCGTVFGDEWDIFDDPAFGADTAEEDSILLFDSADFQFTVSPEAELIITRDGTAAEGSLLHNRFDLAGEIARKSMSLSLDCGVHTALGIQSGKPQGITPGIEEALVSWNPFPGAYLLAGISPVGLGNSLYLNPVDFLAPYRGDPRYPGSSGFPMLEASLLRSGLKFSIVHIPFIKKPSDFFISDLPGSFMLLSAHCLLGEGSTVFRVFFESREGWKNPFYYSGFTAELQAPVSRTVNISSQFIVTDSLQTYTAVRSEEDPAQIGAIASSRQRGEYRAGFSVISDLALFSVIQVSLGYRFNGTGLSDRELGRATASGGEEPALYGLAVYPIPYMRHTLFTSIGIPRLTDSSGVYINGYTSTLDGSSRITGSFLLEAGRFWTFGLNAVLYAGRKSTLFGIGPYTAYIGLEAECTL